MKSSTKYFMALGVSALAGTAMAQTTFEESKFEGFPTIHRTVPVAADFTNNGWLDIYHAGQLDPDLDKAGIWGWTQTSTFIFNKGTDLFDINKWTAAQNDEPETDDQGNVLLDENGDPIYKWHMVDPGHGVRVSSFNSSAAIDYNNDGLLDLIQFGFNNSDDWTGWGDEWKTSHVTLYKNNGDGTFSMVEEAAIPNMKPDNDGTPFAIAVGDYDRDGFVDFIVSATEVTRGEGEDLLPGRAVNLYRNINGSGKFENMRIASVNGGVWTNESKSPDEKDEEGNVIVPGEVIAPREQLEGWFAPCSGNVHFADINNDGWLDIVNIGWMDDCHIGDRKGGHRAFIYLNREGKAFEEVTPSDFIALRSAGTAIADFDFDGYFDFYVPGWSDNGYGWEAFLYTNTQDETALYELPMQAAELGLEGNEGYRPIIRDFDGDGNYDIYYNGKPGENNQLRIFYGDNYGKFSPAIHEGMVEEDKYSCVGDLNNNGLTDIFHTGYGTKDRLFYNVGTTPEAPAAPENVKVNYADGQLNVSWEYDEDTALIDGLAYNLYIKNANGTYCLIPADIETGFLKVAEGKHVALRPNQMSYSIATDIEDAEVGVQAISLKNETYSAFAKAVTSGVKEISADKAIKNLKVSVVENGIIVAGNGEAVTVFNAQGQKVAAGVAGEVIALDAKGIYVVATANGSAKLVK